ncbi:MAG: hypothetical protein WD069_04310 [Planctomycetales bacterium]
MSDAPELLARCRALDIRLLPVGDGELTIDSPAGSLSPDLIERLKASKREVLALLNDPRRPDPAPNDLVEWLNGACPADRKLTDAEWRTLDPLEDDSDAYLAAALAIFRQSAMCSESDTDVQPDAPRLEADIGCPDRNHPRWRSIFGPHLICGTCHPPARPEIVAEWFEAAGAEQDRRKAGLAMIESPHPPDAADAAVEPRSQSVA